MGRKAGCTSFNDSPVYVRVSEVWHFAKRGVLESEIAEVLELEVQEVHWILTDVRGYHRAKGVEPRAVARVNDLPLPDELKKRMAVEFAGHLRRKAAETSTHYDYGGEYDRPVVPHRRKRRRGY